MGLFRSSLCLLAIAVLSAGAGGIADTPQRSADSKSSSAPREEPAKTTTQPATPSEKSPVAPSPLFLDLLKLPPGAVLVICDEVREALRLVPKAIVLTPQDYQRLLDQSEQSKKTEPDKPDNPSSCKLTGHVDGDWAYLRAQFGFKTDRPASLIQLGCAGARPTSATLDGSQAALQEREEGFVLQVDTPGLHQTIVDLQVPLQPRKGGFELDLPRAAITTLDQLDLPATVTEVRVGGRAVRTTRIEAQRSRLEGVPIVPTRHLSVAWKGPAAKPAKGPPVRAVDGRIVVRISETHVFTDAEFNLQVLKGEAAEWQLRLPVLPDDAHLEVKTPPQEEPRIQGMDHPNDKHNPILTIRLNEPSAEPLHLVLHIRQPRPASSLAVGPFAVVGALTQKGEIEIHAPDALRLRPQAAGEVRRKEVSEDQRGQNVRAVFDYWNMPGSAQPAQFAPPLLTLQLESVKGAVETHVTQNLHLEADAQGAAHWRATTRIELTPIRTGVDQLEVTLPADYEYDKAVGATPAEIVEDVVVDRTKQVAQIKLAQKQNRAFALTLPGSYPVREGRREASLELVRPLNWSVDHGAVNDAPSLPVLDRGCQVNATLPDGLEFVTRSFRSSPGNMGDALSTAMPSARLANREYSWQGERTPPRLDLAWRSHRPELPVETIVDLIFIGHQARVREHLRYQLGSSPPGRLLLAVPAEVQSHVKILEGGQRDAEESRSPGTWAVTIPASTSKVHTLTLEYTFPLNGEQFPESASPSASTGRTKASRIPHPASVFTVPLVKPLQATRGETRVRIWCDPDVQPVLAGGPWTELATEIVPEQASLPMLVLGGSHDAKLLLRLTEPAAAHLSAAVVERILVEASIREEGVQAYRARFLLSRLSARHLDIELPVLLSRSDLEVRLDGKRVPLHFVDDSGKETEIGRRLRLSVEPDLYHGPVLLDVSYQADGGRIERQGPFSLTLQPPVLKQAILLGRARWQISVPAGWLALSGRDGPDVEQHWGWWGWLLAPRPAWNRSELEQWLGGTTTLSTAAEDEPSLVGWQSTLASLTLVQVPQRLWLLICSFTVLVLGLGLWLAPLSRVLFWSALAVTALTLAAIGMAAPSTLPAIFYGCEPGVLVLLLAVVAQWMLHERYRRQVVLMPGFSRLKTGSSIVPSPRPRDPSTIDEPPKRPSSIVPRSSGQ
ncbi:MAG TPA: hypothetical protein VKU02_33500 [Gemmataceae bacterium]|nr:hypothetical protein [Gemmataceae bacterium]